MSNRLLKAMRKHRRMPHATLLTLYTVALSGALLGTAGTMWWALGRESLTVLAAHDILPVGGDSYVECAHPAGACEIMPGLFEMDRREITAGEWTLCVVAGACPDISRGDPTLPMVNVTWHQARGFCRWRGGDLPDEGSWEGAARGRHGFNYPWGQSPPDCVRANFKGCSSRPRAGSTATANADGFEDMAGNVAEWVQRRFSRSKRFAISVKGVKPRTSVSPDSYEKTHVARGGSFRDADVSTIARRLEASATDDIGFRCEYRRLLDDAIAIWRTQRANAAAFDSLPVDLVGKDELGRLKPYIRNASSRGLARVEIDCKPKHQEALSSESYDDVPGEGAMALDRAKWSPESDEKSKHSSFPEEATEEECTFKISRGNSKVHIITKTLPISDSEDLLLLKARRKDLAEVLLVIFATAGDSFALQELIRLAGSHNFAGRALDFALSQEQRALVYMYAGDMRSLADLGAAGLLAIEHGFEVGEIGLLRLEELLPLGGAVAELAEQHFNRMFSDQWITDEDLRDPDWISQIGGNFHDLMGLAEKYGRSSAILESLRHWKTVHPHDEEISHAIAAISARSAVNAPLPDGVFARIDVFAKRSYGYADLALADDVRTHIIVVLPLLERCHNEARRSSVFAEFSWTVSTSGDKAVGLDIRADSALKDCFSEAIKGLKFPAHLRGTAVTVRIRDSRMTP